MALGEYTLGELGIPNPFAIPGGGGFAMPDSSGTAPPLQPSWASRLNLDAIRNMPLNLSRVPGGSAITGGAAPEVQQAGFFTWKTFLIMSAVGVGIWGVSRLLRKRRAS